MSKLASVLGGILLTLGLVIGVTCGTLAIRDPEGDLHKAKLIMDRNPGNDLYKGQYFAALGPHIAYAALGVVGGLLALNGLTLVLLGRVAPGSASDA